MNGRWVPTRDIHSPLVLLLRFVGAPHHVGHIAKCEMRPGVAIIKLCRPPSKDYGLLYRWRHQGPTKQSETNIAKASMLCAGA